MTSVVLVDGDADFVFLHIMQERTVGIVMPIAEFPSWVRDPLGAWSLRACCRKDVPGTEVVIVALLVLPGLVSVFVCLP